MTRHVAIIGAGIGAEHAAGYAQLPDRFHVATICDLDEARGRALAETLPGAQWVASLDAVLADPAIDVVDVCLPPHLHVMAATRALEAGKHVICEKPLATSLEAADKLAALAAGKGLMLSPVFQYRYGRGGAQMRALSRAGLTGGPSSPRWKPTGTATAPITPCRGAAPGRGNPGGRSWAMPSISTTC